MTRQPGLPPLATDKQRDFLTNLMGEIDRLGGDPAYIAVRLKDNHLLLREASDLIKAAKTQKDELEAASEREKPSRERRREPDRTFGRDRRNRGGGYRRR